MVAGVLAIRSYGGNLDNPADRWDVSFTQWRNW